MPWGCSRSCAISPGNAATALDHDLVDAPGIAESGVVALAPFLAPPPVVSVISPRPARAARPSIPRSLSDDRPAADLRKISLFQSITDAHLSELMGVASSARFAIGPSSPP